MNSNALKVHIVFLSHQNLLTCIHVSKAGRVCGGTVPQDNKKIRTLSRNFWLPSDIVFLKESSLQEHSTQLLKK